MSGIVVLLLYLTCLFMGFCGGVFGYMFAKDMEKKKRKKEPPETIIKPC